MSKNKVYGKKIRFLFFIFIFAVCIVLYFGRLISLQIANNQYYTELATPKNVKTGIIETSRGEICDRNGTVLVTNKLSYDLTLNRTSLPSKRENEVILNLVQLLENYGMPFHDALALEDSFPYGTVPFDDIKTERLYKNFVKTSEFSEEQLSDLYNSLLKRYNISSTIGETASDDEIRKVVGIRYTLEANDFGIYNPFTLFHNIDVNFQSAVSENIYTMPGVEISVSGERYYNYGSLAAHILGRIGAIGPDEVDTYLEKGYSLDALIGKSGAESAFEEYLHGEDGIVKIEYDSNTEQILNKTISKQPKNGLTVFLTINSGLQSALESSLSDIISSVKARAVQNGSTVNVSGAAVVQNPNTGEIYAIANFPTYDQNTYSDMLPELLSDPGKPLLNRATNGIYPPGSTFKIATASAALANGVIDENTSFYDKGIYTEYETYQPKCWIFGKTGRGHGWQNVTQAIENSCNYFFFEVGKRMGIRTLNEHARKLGLGSKTGIETGEAQGILASPEYRASIGEVWNPGDVLQASIGQSDNAFTPIQLSSFFSTVVNGGTRYKTHILKSINEFHSDEPIYTYKPVVLDKISISEKNLSLLKRGMKSVVEDGTAASVFVNYPYSVGGKTGTAQTGAGDDNAVFAGFAPFDEPKIVVSVIIENGSYSTTAATVAKSVFDYYFQHIDEFN